MATVPSVKITCKLSSDTYKRSAPESEKPQLIVTTLLAEGQSIVLETRGETDSGTVLEDRFRAEHFEFFDLTTSQPVVHSPFPGTCEPRESLQPDEVVQLTAGKPLVTRRQLEDMSPLSDPVRLLEAGHEYRLRLKTQNIPAYMMSKEDLFRGRSSVPVEQLPEAVMITLDCQDEVVLKIED